MADQGWFREPPERSTDRWSFRAAAVLVVGVLAAFGGTILPSSGLVLLGAGHDRGGRGHVHPRPGHAPADDAGRHGARLAVGIPTHAGKTLEQSRTMDQVVASRAVPWLETPDQAVVWGYALGLHEEVEDVLARSVDVAFTRPSTPVYLPTWYVAMGGGAGRGQAPDRPAHHRACSRRRSCRTSAP